MTFVESSTLGLLRVASTVTAGLLAAVLLSIFKGGLHVGPWMFAGLVAVWSAAVGVTWVFDHHVLRSLMWGSRVVLGPEGVWTGRARCVTWSTIESIAVADDPWWLGRRVELLLFDGPPVFLPQPAWLDSCSDEIIETIGAWWVAYRGADWRPGRRTVNPVGISRAVPKIRTEWLPPSGS